MAPKTDGIGAARAAHPQYHEAHAGHDRLAEALSDDQRRRDSDVRKAAYHAKIEKREREAFPELLEACKLAEIQIASQPETIGSARTLALVRAAIAKAEGGA